MQIGEVTFPALRLPDWVLTAVVVTLLIGFPIVAIIAWIFDKTPDGIVRTQSLDSDQVATTTKVGNMEVKVDTRPFYLQKKNIFLLLGVIAGILIGQINFFGSEGKLVNYTGDRIPVAIADFENNTNDASLDGLSGLLITSLEQSNYLSVLTKSRMFDLLKQIGKSDIVTVNEELGVEICERADINSLVLTSIRQFGDLYSVDLKILDVEKNEYLYTTNVQAEGKKNIPDLIDQISKQTRISLAERAEEVEKNQREIASLTTRNLEAYKYYDLGEKAMFSFNWDEAEKNFLKAIEIDSTFALAHYYLSYTYQWFFNSKKDYHIEKAVSNIESVPDKERLYIRAQSIKDLTSRIPLFEEIIDKYPNEKIAYFEIGDMLYHNDKTNESIPYFQKSLTLDPSFEYALQHLGWSYVDMNRHDENIELANHALTIFPNKRSYKQSQFDAYLDAGKFDDFFTLARDLEDSEVKILNPDKVFGDGFLRSGDYENAYKRYSKLLDVKNTEISGLYSLRDHSIYRGDYKEFISFSDRLLQSFIEEGQKISYVNELVLRAFTLIFTFDRPKESQKILREIESIFNSNIENIKIDDLYLSRRVKLLDAYVLNGEWEKINETYLNAVDFSSVNKNRLTAMRYQMRGDFQQSINYLEDPQKSFNAGLQYFYYYHLAKDYSGLKNHNKSLELFNRMKNVKTNSLNFRKWFHAKLFLHAGLENLELNNYRQAKSNLETFLKIWEPAPEALKEKKLARESLKKIAKAIS